MVETREPEGEEETVPVEYGAMLPLPELEMGKTIDRYVLASSLGKGGMGVVYRAYDPKLQREVAIKVVRSDWTGHDQEARRRFLREARTMARLQDPNIVQVFDVLEEEGRLFIVMELIVGTSARQWRRSTRPEWDAALEVYIAAGRGLAAAHAAGVIHRDFKPGNVLVGADGGIRVTDFGLSRLSGALTELDEGGEADGGGPTIESVQSVQSMITRDGIVMGTPVYMSPEQAVGGLADEVSDQYSFCVSLWEALYGKRPFPDDTLDAARLRGAPSPPNRTVPAYVYRALAKGLRPSTVERHASMNELLRALSSEGRPRRLRWIVGSTVGLGMVGALAAGPLLEARAVAACDEGRTQIEGVWSPVQRTAVREGLAASGAIFAEETWARLEPGIDRYVEAWGEAWEEGCARSASTANPELPNAATVACLGEASVQLETELEVLTSASSGAVRGAVQGIDGLPTPDECTKIERIESRYPANGGPSMYAAVVQLRRMMAQAHGLSSAGQYEEALEMARRVHETATGLGWMPVAAEAQYMVGDLLEEKGDYTQADIEIRAAFDQAMGHGLNDLSARIARKRCWFDGVRRGRLEAGLAWCDFAKSLFGRVEHPSSSLGGLIAQTRGMLLADAGRYEEAEQEILTALELRREALGNSHPWVAASLKELGDVRGSLGDLDENRRLLEEALAMYEASLGAHHPYTSELEVSLGNVATFAKDYDEAATRYLRALSLAESGLGSDHPQVGLILSALAGARRRQGRLDDSESTYRRALKILHTPDAIPSPNLGVTLREYAKLQEERGDIERARQFYLEAKEVFAEAVGPENVYVQGVQARLNALPKE